MKPKQYSSQLKKLISLLSDREYHSGTDMGNTLGLTRSGIWKLIKQLEELGIEFESLNNKGYRLTHPIELLDTAAITKHVSKPHQKQLESLCLYDEVTSTNDYLLERAKQTKTGNIACFAEHQTAGRGRLGRQWVSPFAANLYLSLLWHFDRDISELAGLNIAMGVTVANSIRDAFAVKDIQLKWPNDIIWNHRKLGGILIDMRGEYSGRCAAVIGIGINVSMPHSYDKEINKPWVDLQTVAGLEASRNKLAGILLNQMIDHLCLFQENGITPFIEEWNALDYLTNKYVVINSVSSSQQGIAQGINNQGHLLIKPKTGPITAISTGDATVSKISS